MLKHCSQSSVDVKRRSLRQNTTLERRLTSSLLLIQEEDRGAEEGWRRLVPPRVEEEEVQNLSLRNPYSVSHIGLATLPRNMESSRNNAPVSVTSLLCTSSLSSSLTDVRSVGTSIATGPRPIKVYARCLRSDIEYKTMSVDMSTTSKQVILNLLNKFKMKHRDPKLFYLSMDVSLELTGSKTTRTIILEDEARPADLVSCNPWGECKFSLRMKKGGLVRVHDSVLMAESKYKCLLISTETTVRDVIRILLSCYSLETVETVDRFSLYEESEGRDKRKLSPADRPLEVTTAWSGQSGSRLVLRREGGRKETFSRIYFEPKEDTLSDSSGHDTLSDTSRDDTFSESSRIDSLLDSSSRHDTMSDSSDYLSDCGRRGRDRYHTYIQLDMDQPNRRMETSFSSDSSSDRDSPRHFRQSSQVTITSILGEGRSVSLIPKAPSLSSLSSSSDCCNSVCDPLHDYFILI